MVSARLPALDGIRGIALLLVFFCHTRPQAFPGGHLGVDMFFVLSGFLITSILLRESNCTGSISIRRFYIRRALRLLPALIGMVTAVLIYTAIFQPEKLAMALADSARVALYVYNWTMSSDWQHIVELHQIMFTHLWSLSVEEQFYLVWPWLLLGLTVLRGSPRLLLPLILAGLVAPSVARSLVWEGGAALWIYFRTDLRFDALLWGALIAWIMHWDVMPKGWLGRASLAWIGMASLLALFMLSQYEFIVLGWGYEGAFSAIGCLSALLIAAAIWCPPTPLRWLLEMRWLRWTGRISYGLYLWHMPIILLSADIANPWLRNLTAITGTFAVASLSYYFLELPFLRLKGRFGHAAEGLLPPASQRAPGISSAFP
jgi:peptidoglycan/LPS O-acetylase OafA/YrhL